MIMENERTENTPQEARNTEDFDVNQIIEGGSPDDTFNVPETEAEGQEQHGEQNNNDDKRYQYWQSQADKQKNDNTRLQQELEHLKGQVSVLSQQKQTPDKLPKEEKQGFPPPPQVPQKPAGYSYSTALSDPESTSAQYLEQKEEWRDQMINYNQLRVEYGEAIQKEYADTQRKQSEKRIRETRQRNETIQKVKRLEYDLQQKYSATPQESRDFVRVMSSPGAVTLDNLWKLYTMQNGNNPQEQRRGPSESYKQTRQTQSIPTPMGVLPGTGNTQKSASEMVMDKMIADEKNRNPF